MSESLLFKAIWFVFIPLLPLLYGRLKTTKEDRPIYLGGYILLSVTVHLVMLTVMGALLSDIFYNGRYSLYKFFTYTLANDLYILVLVYSGFVLAFYYISKSQRNKNQTSKNLSLDILIIQNGKEKVLVKIADIIQITAENPYILVHTLNKKYLYNESLKSVITKMDNEQLIRVHKSTLVNIQKVKSFKSRLNGDYDLVLENGEIVRLSRTYAAGFKDRFMTTHQVST
jgi:hypothetical protein